MLCARNLATIRSSNLFRVGSAAQRQAGMVPTLVEPGRVRASCNGSDRFPTGAAASSAQPGRY